jgi:hypothetical protein
VTGVTVTALDTLLHRIAGPHPSLAAATIIPSATGRTGPHCNPLDQQLWAFDGSHCAGISAASELLSNHVWLEAVLEELRVKGSLVQDPVLEGQFMLQMIFCQLHFRLSN